MIAQHLKIRVLLLCLTLILLPHSCALSKQAAPDLGKDYQSRITKYFANASRLPSLHSYAYELYFETARMVDNIKDTTRNSIIGHVAVGDSSAERRVDYRDEQFYEEFQVFFGSYLVGNNGVQGFFGAGPRFLPMKYEKDVPVNRAMGETYYFRNPCLFALESWDSIRMNYIQSERDVLNVDVVWSELLDDGKIVFATLSKTGTVICETTFAKDPTWAPVAVRALMNPGPPVDRDQVVKLTSKAWRPFIEIETVWLDVGKCYVPVRHRNIYNLDGRMQDVRWRTGRWKFGKDVALDALELSKFNSDRLTDPDYFDDLLKSIGEDQSGQK